MVKTQIAAQSSWLLHMRSLWSVRALVSLILYLNLNRHRWTWYYSERVQPRSRLDHWKYNWNDYTYVKPNELIHILWHDILWRIYLFYLRQVHFGTVEQYQRWCQPQPYSHDPRFQCNRWPRCASWGQDNRKASKQRVSNIFGLSQLFILTLA